MASKDQESSSSQCQQGEHWGGGVQLTANQPQPPPFNPLLTQGQLGLGHSFVPDLMQIYESITQSSTPQLDVTASEQATAHAQSYEQNMYQLDAQALGPQAHAQYTYSATTAAVPAEYYMMQPSGQQNSVPGNMSQEGAPASSTFTESQPQLSSSGRALRKRSSDRQDDDKYSSDGSATKSRKKGNSDGRWSKRFTWPEELHRDFVSAIFDVGLKHSSPSAVLAHMPKHEDITGERVKSHLQKYRIHRSKSKNEFMSSYAASLSKFHAVGIDGVKSLAGGEVAAHLSYRTTMEEQAESTAATIADATTSSTSQSAVSSSPPGTLKLPRLTEEEKKSPIGASMTYLMGLFFSLRQQLMAQRVAVAAGSLPQSQTPPASADSNQTAAYATSFTNPGVLQDPNAIGPEHATAAQGQTGSSLMSPPSSTRTNIEESHIMKRDMACSREIQSKMRAMKQQEQHKINQSVLGSVGDIIHEGKDGSKTPQTDVKVEDDDSKVRFMEGNEGSYQGAGETAEGGIPGTAGKDRNRGLSIGASEEFWVDDAQLFEFLMDS